jgi:hypothetical protein
VSAPLRWDEISALGRPDAFTIANMPDRLAKVGDLLAPALKLPQKLPTRVFAAGASTTEKPTAKATMVPKATTATKATKAATATKTRKTKATKKR